MRKVRNGPKDPAQVELFNQDGAVPRILLYEDIGWWGVTAAGIKRQLDNIGKVDEIELVIHSRGGSVFEAFPIAAMLRKHPARIVATIEGVALSAASYIPVAAADRIVISTGGLMMMHDAWASTEGNVQQHERAIALLQKIQPVLVAAYANRMTLDEDEVAAAMAKDLGAGTWYNAAEALAVGLVDEIVDMPPPKNAVDLSGFENAPREAVARFSAVPAADPVDALAAEILEFMNAEAHQGFPRGCAPPDQDTLALIESLLTN